VRQILDSRLRIAIPEMWPSRVTIRTATVSVNAANQPVITGFTSVAGMIDLEARMAPFIVLRPDDTQIREQAVTQDLKRRNCKLNSYQPTIVNDMYALIDGTNYKIVGVEPDSCHFSTRLHLELITP